MSEVLKPGQQYQAEAGDAATSYGRIKGEGVDTSHGAILYLEDITVSFDGFRALNKLNLDISVGELRCIIGPNGAGKTTMMDVITGKTRPTSGSAWFGQTIDLTRMTEYDIAHAGIGRKFQRPTVFEQHTVFENLELAMKMNKRVKQTLFFPPQLGTERQDRRDPETDPPLRPGTPAGRAAVAWPEAVAGNRHAADAGAATAAARRAGGRHVGCRDRAHRRAAQ
jgi:urea transport system ATP-binding protein